MVLKEINFGQVSDQMTTHLDEPMENVNVREMVKSFNAAWMNHLEQNWCE